jgi:adenosylcobinamide kinase/adenosylcobinamide-phosphate guanylyltransferase
VSRVLVLGGNRSGKSEFAEALLASEPTVEYVATADDRPGDGEWAAHIQAHRARRPAGWQTSETRDVAGVLLTPGPPVLVDSITTWLAAAIDGEGNWLGGTDERVDELCRAWSVTRRHAVLVTDEVGMGIVPATESGRRFRDALGRLNQRLAAAADEVHLIVAGVPLRLR